MLSELDFYKMHQTGKIGAIQEKLQLLGFHLVQNNEAFDTAESPASLDYMKLDLFVGWSIVADYGKRLCQVAKVEPICVSYGDAVFAVNAEFDSIYYVDGSVFVPCAIRDRLVDWMIRGEFDVFKAWLPCVTVKPILTTQGPASLYHNPSLINSPID